MLTGLDKLRARSGAKNLGDAPDFLGAQILPSKKNSLIYKFLVH